MIGLNMRWLCGRLRRTRKLWVIVVLTAILALLGKSLRSGRATDDDTANATRDEKNIDPEKTPVDLQRNTKLRKTSLDLQKAFDHTDRRAGGLTTNSLSYPGPALDGMSPRPSARVRKRLYSTYRRKTSFNKNRNETVFNSGDPQKAFVNINKNSALNNSADLQKTFDSTKRNSSALSSFDRRNVTNETSNFKRIASQDLPKIFKQRLTGQEKSVVFEILKALDGVSVKLDLPYFLCGGTLLGSFRHHDLTPWDDDIDVYMNLTERDAIYSGLASLAPDFEVYAAGCRLKVYSRWSRWTDSRYPWKFPYVDINFYAENFTHIVDSDPTFVSLAYRKDTIFPLHRRPLGGLFLFAPFDTYSYLAHTYWNITICATSHYDHRNEVVFEESGGQRITMCRRLRPFVPFVYRTPDPNSTGILETLKIGDTELHTIVVEEPQYVVGDPFSLIPLPAEPRGTRRELHRTSRELRGTSRELRGTSLELHGTLETTRNQSGTARNQSGTARNQSGTAWN